METHTVDRRGDARPASAGCSANVGHLVRSCHERYDGGGYPDGLAGERDPARRADRLLLRRLQRDDDRPALPRGRGPPRRRSPSSGAAPGRSSTRTWSRRSRASCQTAPSGTTPSLLEVDSAAVKVLLVGSGGREHALAWKLAQAPG